MRSKLAFSLLLLAFLPLMASAGYDLPDYPDGLVSPRTDILDLISLVDADSILSYMQTLQDFQTRYALADNCWEVADWIRDQFVRFGIAGVHMHEYAWSGTQQYNPVAILTGSEHPEVYILVGGHHDSITYADPMNYAPGADDNASGASAVIELARVISTHGFQPKCSLILTTFSAEEVGQCGSQSYVQQILADSLDLRLAINLDMIANNEPGHSLLKILRYDGSICHSLNAAAITSLYTDLEPAWGYYNYNGTDSYSFWQEGFNVFTISEYDFSPFWHTDQDIVDNTDPLYCANMVKALTAITAIYCTMPLVPENLEILDTGTGDALMAVWDDPPDQAIDHYNVYIGASEYDLQLWGSVQGNESLITGLSEGTGYLVGVSSVDAQGNESYPALSQGVPLSLPRAPEGLADHPGPGSILLSWNPNSELDLAGYNLYRSLDPADTGECVATIQAPQASFTDADLPGTLDYYCYRVGAFDMQNNEGPLSGVLQSRPVTLDMGVLIVDETRDYSGGNPFQPTDEMVDSFYDALLEGFNIGFHLDLEDDPDPLRLADIGVFSSLFWHGNDFADMSYPGSAREVLRQYLLLGGNILFSVYQPGTAFENSYSYPAWFGPDSFIAGVLGIGSVDYSPQARFRYALPEQPGFPALEVDSLKTVPYLNGHIFRVEGMGAGDPAETVYDYASDYEDDYPEGYLNGQAVGVIHQSGQGIALTLSFPLYNMLFGPAREMALHVFGSIFGESTPVQDPAVPGVVGLELLPGRPNPFSASIRFTLRTSDPSNPIKAGIYNVRGQLVKDLAPTSGNSILWDGKDNLGRKAGSGVYIIRVRQNGLSASEKILLVK